MADGPLETTFKRAHFDENVLLGIRFPQSEKKDKTILRVYDVGKVIEQQVWTEKVTSYMRSKSKISRFVNCDCRMGGNQET